MHEMTKCDSVAVDRITVPETTIEYDEAPSAYFAPVDPICVKCANTESVLMLEFTIDR